MLHRQDEEGGRRAEGAVPRARQPLQDGQELHLSKRCLSQQNAEMPDIERERRRRRGIPAMYIYLASCLVLKIIVGSL